MLQYDRLGLFVDAVPAAEEEMAELDAAETAMGTIVTDVDAAAMDEGLIFTGTGRTVTEEVIVTMEAEFVTAVALVEAEDWPCALAIDRNKDINGA